MTDQTQDELFKPDFGWFHFFRQIIQNKTWAGMSLAASKLYPVVKSYCNSDNGAAFPSYELLVEMTGLSTRSIKIALDELVELDLITAKKTKGKVTVYAIKETFAVKHPVNGKEGTACFNYVSKNVSESVADLKEFLKTGVAGKNITLNFIIAENVYKNNFGNMDMRTETPKIDNGEQIENILQMLDKKDKQPVDNL